MKFFLPPVKLWNLHIRGFARTATIYRTLGDRPFDLVARAQIPWHFKIVTSLAAGAVAASVSKTVIAPLEFSKLHFQGTPF